MARILRIVSVVAVVALGPPMAPSATAHHLMGGRLPATLWEGLLSGLGHPVIGLDHLAFVVGVGTMAYLLGRMALLPIAFVAGTVAGCALHVQRLDLPAAELGVAATVAVAAVLVTARTRLPAGLLALLLAAAGVLHGYAYGESIVGAEAAPLAAYIVGFGMIQGCVAVGAALALGALVGRDWLSEARAMRLAGAGLGLVAMVFLATAALAG